MSKNALLGPRILCKNFFKFILFLKVVVLLTCVGVTCYQGYVCTNKFASNPKSTHIKEMRLEGKTLLMAKIPWHSTAIQGFYDHLIVDGAIFSK